MPVSLQQEEGMDIAMRATHNALSNDEVREAIEAHRKWERDRITEMNIAVEAGEARGEARGKAEGEASARLDIARSLLASGQSADLIFQVTGLRTDELE